MKEGVLKTHPVFRSKTPQHHNRGGEESSAGSRAPYITADLDSYLWNQPPGRALSECPRELRCQEQFDPQPRADLSFTNNTSVFSVMKMNKPEAERGACGGVWYEGPLVSLFRSTTSCLLKPELDKPIKIN